MADKLFERLNRAARGFVGAPDPEETRISPQMQSNLDKRAARIRFQGFRRMQGRPGITGPFGFVAGRTAPISAPAAAGWVSDKLGTGFAPELGRLTAPDPKAFAEGAIAPEFAQAKLAKRVGAGRLIGAEAGTLEAKLPFVGRREEAEIAGLVGTEERAGELAETELGGIATPEELAEDRAIARRQQETEAVQAEREDQLATMADDIASLEDQGFPDEAQQIRQQRDALLGGEPAPDRAPPGGVTRLPAITQIARRTEREEGIMDQMGFTDEWMDGIVGGLGGTGAFKISFRKTEQKLEMLVRALKTASPEIAEALANQIRPRLPDLQQLKRFGHPLSLLGRASARLLDELESLLMNSTQTPEVPGGAPPIMPPPFPGVR